MATRLSYEQLVKRVISQLLQSINGENDVANVNKHFDPKIRLSNRELAEILEMYGDTFNVQGGPYYRVALRPCLVLCPVHSCESGSCPPGSCAGLHICKFFLLSGDCGHKDKCLFGHDLLSWHNKQVLQRCMLDHLNVTELRIVLTIPDNRCPVTRPEICRYYNKKFGCKKKNSCRSVHICRPYVLGECKFGRNCRREHDIFNEQVKNVLRLYGVNTACQPKYILDELKQYEEDSSNKSGVEGSDVDGSDDEISVEGDGYRDCYVSAARSRVFRSTPNLFQDQAMAVARPKDLRTRFPSTSRKPRHKSASESYEIFYDSRPVATGEICIYKLQGGCAYGQRCCKIHTDTNFLWQFSPFSAMDDQQGWRSFDSKNNETLEKNFSQPDLENCFVDMNGEVVEVNFKRHTAQSQGCKYNIRRLSTPSSVIPAMQTRSGQLTSVGVIWLWYYQSKDGYWQRIEESESNTVLTSDKVEAYYLESQDSCKILSGIELNFRKMTMTATRTGKQHKLRRRPMYMPSGNPLTVAQSPQTAAMGMNAYQAQWPLQPTLQDKTSKRSKSAECWTRSGFAMQGLQPMQRSFAAEPRHTSLSKVPLGIRRAVNYMLNLEPSSDEFQMVERHFKQKIGRSCIIQRIFKIINEDKASLFQKKRREMMARAGYQGVFEKQNLYYGAPSAEKLEKACCNGVKCSPPEVSMVCCKGCHLYDSAAKADKSSGQGDHLRHLLVTDCLVGDYAQGFSGATMPPKKLDGTLYDSCVDDVSTPKIFVVFEESQDQRNYHGSVISLTEGQGVALPSNITTVPTGIACLPH